MGNVSELWLDGSVTSLLFSGSRKLMGRTPSLQAGGYGEDI